MRGGIVRNRDDSPRCQLRYPARMRRAGVVVLLVVIVALCATVAVFVRASGTSTTARAADPLPLGFNSQLFYEGRASAIREATYAAKAGATLHRMQVAWRDMQRDATDPVLPDEGGKPVGELRDQRSDLAKLDRGYLEQTSRHIKPILIVWDAPVWATRYARCQYQPFTFGNCRQTHERLVPDAEHLPQWKKFVTAVTQRYPKALIETWNEPNIRWGQTPGSPSPEEMAVTSCAAYDAVRAIDPVRTVLSPGLAEKPNLDAYLQRMLAAGAARCWNVYSVHLYFGDNTSFQQTLTDRLNDLRTTRAAAGDRDPMWVTEAGWTTSGSFSVSPSDQATSIMLLHTLLSQQPDVGALLIHTLRDAPRPLIGGTANPEYGYGLLRSDWTPKPAYSDLAATG